MVEWKKLGEIGTFTRGNGLQKADFVDSGFPCIHYGQIYTRYGLSTNRTITYCSKELAKKLVKAKTGDMIIACTSENIEDVCKAVVWLGEGEVATGGHSCVFSHNQDPKYVAYFFQTEQFFMQKKKYANGVKVIDIKAVDLAKISIPIPSLSEQQRIVSILDTFTSSISNLKQQIEERRKQYEYERDLLLDLEGKEGVEMKKLGEVGDICMCKRIMKDQTSEKGDIPFFKIGTFGGKADAYISRELFEDYKEKYSYPKKGEILISAAGTIGRTVVFNGEDAYFQDSNIVWISNNEQLVLNTFLRYLYGVIDWKIDGGTIKRLYNYNLKNATIYVPTLQAQSRIVSILDTFEQSIANLEEQLAMREKQYEYYRENLLRFEEA